MTLPAYVLQLLTNAPASALSGKQARAIRLADGSRCFFLID